MAKQLKWYQILRIIIPLVYAGLMILGIMSKSITIMMVLMGSALLGGAFYCGWFCPFGAVQEWLAKTARFLNIPRLRVPEKIEKWLRFTRYILLGLSIGGFAFVLFLLSPYGSFFGLMMSNVVYISTIAWILLGVFFILSLFIDRPFCRYFCSEGARYGIVSLARIFTIRRDEERCVSCKICDNSCPVQVSVSNKRNVRNSQCINCFECIAVCPVENTLSYGWAFSKKKNNKIEDVNNV